MSARKPVFVITSIVAFTCAGIFAFSLLILFVIFSMIGVMIPDQSDYDFVVANGSQSPGIVKRVAEVSNVTINNRHPIEIDIESVDGELLVRDFWIKSGYEIDPGDGVLVATLNGKSYPVGYRPLEVPSIPGVAYLIGAAVVAVLIVAGVILLRLGTQSTPPEPRTQVP